MLHRVDHISFVTPNFDHERQTKRVAVPNDRPGLKCQRPLPD
jgi:hypothetical protein